ncbi:hypothetical protein KJ742_03155 [Patescibacteria group bacterium]|nr:hypothetical protein [Patescibacteria group bacterium]MBU1682919.1 hypothetical protein [Patescibacteria group bacterium]MBU1934539.1 hypothetical protein [Patescibacteria group bacterium]
MKKRMLLAIITGAVLGVFCIIGVGYRFGYSGNELFLFATWFNRLLMGMVIGLAGSLIIIKGKYNALIRGALLGLIVSFSFYLATDFKDLTGFIAGIIYGVIIDYVASKYK